MNLKTFIKIRKQHVLLGLVFGFIMILLPIHWTMAGLGTMMIGAVKFMVFAYLSTVFIVLVPISLALFKLSEIVLTWSINPESFGNITDNIFVITAWGMVRDFSNMFFVLIFVAIGIATALRVKAYEIKKTLPRLLGVALLINFSPVICGLVIDMANIFMNFFLTAGASGFNQTISMSSSAGGQYLAAIESAWGNWHQFITGVFFFRLLSVFLFNIFGSLVLFLFATLFLVRNIALWVLVILSPLAFFSYILPATKKIIFDKWKKEFIKWSFIGLTGSFFLYLSQLMLAIQTDQIKSPPTESMEFGGGTLSDLIVSTIPVLFLLIGFFITVSTSAMGTKAISAMAKRGLKYFDPTTKKGRDAIGRLRKGTKQTTDKVVSRIPGVQKISQRVLDKTPEERKAEWTEAGGLKKTGKVAGRVLYSYKRREKRAARMTEALSETKLKKAETAKKEADKARTAETRRVQWKMAKTKEERSGVMESIVENREFANYSKEEQKRVMKEAALVHPKTAQKFYRAAPDTAIEMRDEYKTQIKKEIKQNNFGRARIIKQTMSKSGLILSKEDNAKGYKTFGDKLAGSIQVKDIPLMDPAAFKNKEFLAGTTKLWGGTKMKAVERELGRTGVQEIQQGVDEMGKTNLQRENYSLFKFIEGNAGSEIGLGLPDEARGRRELIERRKKINGDEKEIPTIYQAREKGEGEEEALIKNFIDLEAKKRGEKHRPKENKLGEEVGGEEIIETPEGKITISKKAKKQEAKINKKLGEEIGGGE